MAYILLLWFGFYLLRLFTDDFDGLKKDKSLVFCVWLMLLSFTGGQIILFAHQHKVSRFEFYKNHRSSQQTFTEKCQLYEAMHHNVMVVDMQIHSLPTVSDKYNYRVVAYSLISISLILSSGRAPPVS